MTSRLVIFFKLVAAVGLVERHALLFLFVVIAPRRRRVVRAVGGWLGAQVRHARKGR